jgi:hypothetical protein
MEEYCLCCGACMPKDFGEFLAFADGVVCTKKCLELCVPLALAKQKKRIAKLQRKYAELQRAWSEYNAKQPAVHL